MLRNINVLNNRHITISINVVKLQKTRLNDFSILTTHIESLNAKIDELLIHITELKNINFKYSVICLQETWLSEMDDMSIFHIDGYDSISQGKSCSNKGGSAIYIDNMFDYYES